ncbi:Uncharacterised protein [uncultured archaeon]|nr:Uncharacterised protein [uncultured archaeon]
MESTFSEDFKKFFLITFTEQLIKHSATQDISKLKSLIELKEKNKRETFSPINQKEQRIIKKEIPKKISPPKIIVQQQTPPRPIQKQISRPVVKQTLFIPEPKLPEYLEYLKPAPNTEIEMDLWKLNPLVKDQAVRIIEVNPDEKVVVTGTMGTKQTGIVLNKEDIDRVINRFAEISKIPTNEGVYKVASGNLILSAIISSVIGSKLIIKKMAPNQQSQFSNLQKK